MAFDRAGNIGSFFLAIGTIFRYLPRHRKFRCCQNRVKVSDVRQYLWKENPKELDRDAAVHIIR
jgi:hypothetical protein